MIGGTSWAPPCTASPGLLHGDALSHDILGSSEDRLVPSPGRRWGMGLMDGWRHAHIDTHMHRYIDALHCIALHYTTLLYTTLHYITLHYTTCIQCRFEDTKRNWLAILTFLYWNYHAHIHVHSISFYISETRCQWTRKKELCQVLDHTILSFEHQVWDLLYIYIHTYINHP